MARQKIDKETRKVLNEARKMIEDTMKADGNEAETRRRVERMFSSIMGYDVFKHITREHAVKGAGETEYCDFAIQLEDDKPDKPIILVELKRATTDLAKKHLKQVSSYAINKGCEWVVLTNGREWQLHHISFGQPPQTKLVTFWNLLEDNPTKLMKSFELISYRNVKKGGLNRLWRKQDVLSTRNLLEVILSEDSLRYTRREFKRSKGVTVTPEDLVGAFRRLLNESANNEMEGIKIALPERKRRRTATARKTDTMTCSDETSITGT